MALTLTVLLNVPTVVGASIDTAHRTISIVRVDICPPIIEQVNSYPCISKTLMFPYASRLLEFLMCFTLCVRTRACVCVCVCPAWPQVDTILCKSVTCTMTDMSLFESLGGATFPPFGWHGMSGKLASGVFIPLQDSVRFESVKSTVTMRCCEFDVSCSGPQHQLTETSWERG